MKETMPLKRFSVITKIILQQQQQQAAFLFYIDISNYQQKSLKIRTGIIH